MILQQGNAHSLCCHWFGTDPLTYVYFWIFRESSFQKVFENQSKKSHSCKNTIKIEHSIFFKTFLYPWKLRLFLGNFRHCVRHNAMRPKVLNFSELKSKWAALTKSFAGFIPRPPCSFKVHNSAHFSCSLTIPPEWKMKVVKLLLLLLKGTGKGETQLFCLKSFFYCSGE